MIMISDMHNDGGLFCVNCDRFLVLLRTRLEDASSPLKDVKDVKN